jgi:hexaprenyl-diphosphate synthase
MRRWSSTCVRAASSSAHTTPTRCLHKRAYSPPAAATATAPTTGSHPPPLLTTKPSHTQTPLASSPKVDPYALVGPELDHLRTTLLRLVGSAHPTLGSVAEYYFLHPSKQVRPLIVLLMARATNGLGSRWEEKAWLADVEGASGTAAELDRPLTRPDVLNDVNPNMNDDTLSFSSVFPLRPPQFRPPSPVPPPHILSPTAAPSLASLGRALPSQVRLAQIVEMIHVASLLHDDVIDVSDLRRGQPSAPAKFGPKLSVLGGDFLLGRASAALARLGEHEVTELIAAVIANLVEGEIMQLGREEARPADPALNLGPSRSVASENWNVYLRKTYLKTATLMAKGARAATVLGGTTEGQLWKELAYAYGRNIGIAFQVRFSGLITCDDY